MAYIQDGKVSVWENTAYKKKFGRVRILNAGQDYWIMGEYRWAKK